MGIGVFVTALIFGVALVFYKPKMSEEEIRREAAKLGMVNAVEADIAGSAEEEDTSAKVTVENIPGATGTEAEAEPAEGSAEGADAGTTEADAQGESEASDDANAPTDEAETSKPKAEGTDPSMEYQADQKQKNTAENSTDASGQETAATGTNDGVVTSAGTSSGNSSSADKANSANADNGTNKSSSQTASDGAASSQKTKTGATKKLTIRKGEDSYTTAAHLYKDGLVDNAAKFNTFLESNKYDVKILSGTFNIPEGSSYEEIVDIITGK